MYKFRFFAEFDPVADQWVMRDAGEIKHLSKVLKLNVGDQVELTDGSGHSAVGTISSLSREQVEFEKAPTSTHERPSRRLAVAIGALKHGDIDELVAPLCELGVGRIQIFLQDQMDKSRVSEKALNRWRGICQAALKQSKSSWLCEVDTHKNLDSLQRSISPEATILYLDPRSSQPLLDADLPKQEINLIIGSESGFSISEEQALADDVRSRPCNLGSLILRAKTAAIVAPGLISQRLHKLN